MDDFAVGRPADDARATADHQHHRRRRPTRQRRRLLACAVRPTTHRAWPTPAMRCWRWATPTTTTSAVMDANSTSASHELGATRIVAPRRLRARLRRRRGRLARRSSWQALTRTAAPIAPARQAPYGTCPSPRLRPASPRRYSKKRPAGHQPGPATPRSAGRNRQRMCGSWCFGLPEETISYEAGDALGVWPRNCDRLVDEWLAVTGLDGETPVRGRRLRADVVARRTAPTDSRSPTSAGTCCGSCSSAPAIGTRRVAEAGKQSRAGRLVMGPAVGRPAGGECRSPRPSTNG